MKNQAVLEAACQQIEREARAVAGVAQLLNNSFIEAADLCLRMTGKVIVTGAGTSGHAGRRMAHLLSVSGTPAVFLHPMDCLHGTMGAITKDDVVFAISKGGGSDELNQLCSILREKGTKIVALTENESSELAGLADVTVLLHTPDQADPGNVIAMGSTLVSGVWGDALAYVLMRLRKRSWKETLEIHPAGAVGKMQTAPEELNRLEQ